ncbi:MAG: hypothetical protein RJA59_2204 [Pseudomonadota bacterium]
MSKVTSAEVEAEIRAAQAAGDEGYVTHLRGLLGQTREKEGASAELAKMSTGERLMAGVGRGMLHVGQHVPGLNRLLPQNDVNDTSSDELLNTGAGMAGNLVGEAVATAPVGMGVGAVAAPAAALVRGATTAARFGRFALPLAAEGGAIGGMMSDADTAGGVARDVAIGAGAGVGAGAVVKKAGDFLRRGVRLGGSAPTKEAERLMAEGVQLTPGQARPTGVMNQIEESMQSFPLVGPSITNSRNAAVDQFRGVAARKASPAGFVPTKDAPIQTQIDEISKAFRPVYKQAEGFDIFGTAPRGNTSIPFESRNVRLGNRTVKVKGAFEEAVTDSSRLATRQEQNTAMRFLNDQATILKQANKGGDIVSSDALLQVRSNIRDARRTALQSGDVKLAGIFKTAEQDVTAALEAGLPGKVAKTLKAADGQYAKFADVYEAAAGAVAKDGNFTPGQLLRSVAKGNTKLTKARGALGEMGDLASDAANTFEMKSPPTGARLMPLLIGGTAKIPLANSLPAVIASIGTKPGVAKLVTGNTKVQRALLKGLSDAEKSEAMARIRSMAVRGLAADAVDER